MHELLNLYLLVFGGKDKALDKAVKNVFRKTVFLLSVNEGDRAKRIYIEATKKTVVVFRIKDDGSSAAQDLHEDVKNSTSLLDFGADPRTG